MSDHLIAEANRHLRALTIERDQFRTELALLREWQREVIQNANLHHAELRDAIARAKRAEAELAAERARLDFMLSLGSIARFSAACSKVKIESTGEQWLHDARRAIDAAMKENYK